MPRACTICVHPARDAIDKAIVGEVNKSAIARKYGLTTHAIRRHMAGHLSPALVKASAKREDRRAGSLLDRILRLADEAYSILEGAKTAGQVTAALQAIKTIQGLLETEGRLTGELDDRPSTTVNLLVTADWMAVRDTIFAALDRHPAAAADVASALLALEPPPERAQETG